MPDAPSAKAPFVRRALASILAVGAAVCMRSWGSNLPLALWLPTGLLAASALLLHHPRLGSQLLARAVLWSNLILGVVMTFFANSRERPIAVVLAATTGAALLLVGRAGLDDRTRGGSFVPVAFRATLLALMVMALADAQSLAFFGALQLEAWTPSPDRAALYFALAGGLLGALAGLYRLRVWGLLLGVVSWMAVAAVALAGGLQLPGGLVAAFVATSVLQMCIAAPLFVALWTGARRV